MVDQDLDLESGPNYQLSTKKKKSIYAHIFRPSLSDNWVTGGPFTFLPTMEHFSCLPQKKRKAQGEMRSKPAFQADLSLDHSQVDSPKPDCNCQLIPSPIIFFN